MAGDRCSRCDGFGLIGARPESATPSAFFAAVAAGGALCDCVDGELLKRWTSTPPPPRASRRGAAARRPPPRRNASTSGIDRRARVDAFLAHMSDVLPRRFNRSDVWRAAGYTDPSQFKRWQRRELISPGAAVRFERVLEMDPETFLGKVRRIRTVERIESPIKPHLCAEGVLLSIFVPAQTPDMKANPSVSVRIERNYGRGRGRSAAEQGNVSLEVANLNPKLLAGLIGMVIGGPLLLSGEMPGVPTIFAGDVIPGPGGPNGR